MTWHSSIKHNACTLFSIPSFLKVFLTLCSEAWQKLNVLSGNRQPYRLWMWGPSSYQKPPHREVERIGRHVEYLCVCVAASRETFHEGIVIFDSLQENEETLNQMCTKVVALGLFGGWSIIQHCMYLNRVTVWSLTIRPLGQRSYA